MILYERESWISMVLRVKGSVMPRVMPRVLVVTAVSVVATLLQRYNTHHLTLTVTPFLITGLPLGIILGFRNTASYDRFWEGRKLWGALVNGSRTVLRELAMFVVAPATGTPTETVETEVAAFRKAVTYRLIALAYSLRMNLRRERDNAALRPFLDADEIASLKGERSPPAAILHRLGADLAHAKSRGWTRTRHVATMEATLVGLTDVVGGCERIKNTPTPLSYLIFIHRAVAFY